MKKLLLFALIAYATVCHAQDQTITLNDGGFGMGNTWQHWSYVSEGESTEYFTVHFRDYTYQYLEQYGCISIRIERVGELAQAISNALAYDGDGVVTYELPGGTISARANGPITITASSGEYTTVSPRNASKILKAINQ